MVRVDQDAGRRWPAGPVPAGLVTDRILLRPITLEDAADDHAAVMDSRDELLTWEQTDWPTADFTVAENRADLAGLVERHEAGRSFTFTVRDPADTECRGCVYVFPPDAAFLQRATVTPLGGGGWAEVEAVVYFWARTSTREVLSDAALLDALRTWFREAWAVEPVFVVSERFTRQLELVEGTDLAPRFEIVEPGKPGRYLAFG